MILTTLGSGTIYPNPHRAGPAHLVSHGNFHLLLDIGPGALRSLAKASLDASQLDGVCITHRHPDHMCELTLLIDLERTRNRTRALLLAGSIIFDQLVAFHLCWGRTTRAEMPFPLQRLVLPGKGACGPLVIEGAPVPHVENSVGLRITADGRRLVYPGDCGPGDEVVNLADGADLLLLECSLASGEHSPAHLSPEDAAEIALRSHCRRLVLTHFPPGAEAEEAVMLCRKLGVDAHAAYDGVTYTV